MKIRYLLFLALLSFNIAGAQNWKPLATGTTVNLNSVFFLNTRVGYAAGDSNVVLKTTDGGAHWATLHPLATDTFALKSVFFRSADTGWIAGTAGIIYRTQNGGTTWNDQLLSAYVYSLNSVRFPTKDTGYVVGAVSPFGGGVITKSTDGGFGWPSISGFGAKWLRSAWFLNGQTGYAVGDNGTIIKTTNGAATWAYLISGATSDNYSVCFTTPSTGVVTGSDGTILKTTSAGTNWFIAGSGTSRTLKSVSFYDANNGYISGDNGTILFTSDGGSTWSALYAVTSRNLNSICFPAPDTGYVAGDHGTILKTTNGGGLGIMKRDGSPGSMNLYPNPAGDFITYELSFTPKEARISISDTKGKMMAQQEISSKTGVLDLSKLPPGVYILRLVENRNVISRKIIKE